MVSLIGNNISYEISERLSSLFRVPGRASVEIKYFTYDPPLISFKAQLRVNYRDLVHNGDLDTAQVCFNTNVPNIGLQVCAEGSHFGWIRGCIEIGDLLTLEKLNQ